jgi:Fe-S-cluster containining protein
VGNIRNSACFCGSGKKQKKCHNNFHPESKAANLLKLYKEIDDTTNTFFNESSVPSFCRKGCHHCCYDSLAITPIEFEVILNDLKKRLNKTEIEELFTRALGQNEEIKINNPDFYRLLENNGTLDQQALIKQMNSSSSTKRNPFPCVFLNEVEGLCTVYESRPYICRTFGTTHVSEDELGDYEICEVIPSSKLLIDSTPEVRSLEKERSKIVNINIGGQLFIMRPYPIYYLFKIYYEKYGFKKEIENFESTPSFSTSQSYADKAYIERRTRK